MSNKHKHLTQEEIQQILDLWLGGAGKVKEISALVGRPHSTVYSVLYRTGVWPGVDDHTLVPAGTKLKVTKENRPGSNGFEIRVIRPRKRRSSAPKTGDIELPITMIEPPRPTVWQRIKAMFA